MTDVYIGGESWVSDDSLDVEIIERGTLADYIAAQWGKEVS